MCQRYLCEVGNHCGPTVYTQMFQLYICEPLWTYSVNIKCVTTHLYLWEPLWTYSLYMNYINATYVNICGYSVYTSV